MAEQRDGVQYLRVDGPDPQIGLQTPESMVDRSARVRRNLPTPPLIDLRGVEEHIRRTMDKLRSHKAFRRYLGGAQNNYSDSSISFRKMAPRKPAACLSALASLIIFAVFSHCLYSCLYILIV
jgi:hypothetical protein